MNDTAKVAQLHRLVLPDHTCPFGARAKDLLQEQGYQVDDHPITTREENDGFKREHQVETTPIIFMDGTRLDGLDKLEDYFNLDGRDRSQA